MGENMENKSLEVKCNLLRQIERYLDGEITRNVFGNLAELYYTGNAHLIKNTRFYEAYSGIVPDACLIYIDEPGNEDDKEKCFRIEMENAYEILKTLCNNE